jgi:hypothetical protein
LVGFRSIRLPILLALHASIHCGRYTGTACPASARTDASRQTDLEKPLGNLLATAWCAFATQGFICLSPTSHGSNVLKSPWVVGCFGTWIIARYSPFSPAD